MSCGVVVYVQNNGSDCSLLVCRAQLLQMTVNQCCLFLCLADCVIFFMFMNMYQKKNIKKEMKLNKTTIKFKFNVN